MKLSDLKDRSFLVLLADDSEILVEDITNGYPGNGKFVIRGSGNRDGGGEVEVYKLKEEPLL